MAVTAPRKSYYGFIAEFNSIPIGVCGLTLNQREAELSFAVLPKYQGRGYTKEVIDKICSIAFNEFNCNRVFGEVFVDNPALSFLVWKCGFKAYDVQEKAYWKKEKGFVDVVCIEQRK